MVVFMSSLWPILASTAFGVAGIKRDYLNVSALLQLSWLKRLWKVILPAAAPAIVAGLRISIGSAWVAIVAAEMLIGGTGIGYFVWNEWNNYLTSVIFAILMTGLVGLLLDMGFGSMAKTLTYREYTMSFLEVETVSKYFSEASGRRLCVFEDVRLHIQKSQFVKMVGHSGRGKSNLLNIIRRPGETDRAESLRREGDRYPGT